MKTLLATFLILSTHAVAQTQQPQSALDRLGAVVIGDKEAAKGPALDGALTAYANNANTNAAVAREQFILGGPSVVGANRPSDPFSGAMENYNREYREYKLDQALKQQENSGLFNRQ